MRDRGSLAAARAAAWCIAFAICVATRVVAAPLSGAERIEAVTLDNGMQIIIWPDQDIPNLTLYNFVRVGSRNEVPGITGLAHFFEHMMFNGTRTRAPGEFDRTLEANGARTNAGTSADLTIYQTWFPKTALATVFEMEADRLRNLAFDPKTIESERGVVYSERRLRVDDSNVGRLQEQVQATAFTAHPYSIPTIGWPSDIEAWTLVDLKNFFVSYYAPNNCTLVLVGDVEAKQAVALARQYFEPIPSQPAPPPIRTREPAQQGERHISIQSASQTPLLQVAYHGIAGNDPRQPALELLMRILADGDASRLHRALVEQQQLAISADGYADAGFDPGLVWFYLSLPAGVDPARTQRAFDEEIDRVIAQGVSAAELTRARNQALADFWRGLATIDGKAEALGTYTILRGGYQKLFEAPRNYESVTAQDMQKLAGELLRPANRTVGVLAQSIAGTDAQP